MISRKLCVLSLAFLAGTAAAEYELRLLWCFLFFFGFVWMYVVCRQYKKSVKAIFWSAAFVVLASLGSVNSYLEQ